MSMQANQTRVQLDVTPEQAAVLSQALDLYARLGLGQIEVVAELLRTGLVPVSKGGFEPSPQHRALVSAAVETSVMEIKRQLGFGPGSSLGIFNVEVPVAAKRAYEVKKVLDKAIAEHADPAPAFRTVDYDGLTVRATSDPLPVAEVRDAA